MSRKTSISQRVTKAALATLVVLLLPLWLPLLFLGVTVLVGYGCSLYLAVWLCWVTRGKDVLMVYSDSPIWRDYMIERILPMVQGRAITLNWSERKKWRSWSLAVRAFRFFGKDHDFNPLVIVFRPFRFAKTFRFWSAFKDWKRGNTEPVDKLRQEILMML